MSQAIDFEKYEVVSREEIELYYRSDCPYCVKVYRLLQRFRKWRPIVNKHSRDLIGLAP